MTLSNGWKTVRLGDVCDILSGFGFPKRLQGKASGDLAFFKVGDISEAWKRGDVLLSEANHYLDVDEAAGIRAKPLPENTTVFAKIGAAIALNRRAILSEPALVDNNVMGLHPASNALDHKYLYHFFCTVKLDELSRATTVPSVRKGDIQQIEIPMPGTIADQRRIVAEIEKQFARLDAGVAGLKRVQANLKRYRASVLKAACEGKLVETEAELQQKLETGNLKPEWETGEQLLERILIERRKAHEEQQKNAPRRKKYKEPAVPDTKDLPNLPKGWVWVTLDALAAVKGGITKDSKRKFSTPSRLVPYLRVANVQRGSLNLSEVKEIEAPEEKIDELRLLKGDVLFNEGGDRDKLGRGWIWNCELPECIHQNHVFRARLFIKDIIPKYLSWYANTFGQQFFFDQGKQTTNLASISMTKLKRLPVPIPPPAEQKRIVEEVERRLSVIEEMEAAVEANLKRAARLRQSILKKAFEGKLV